MPKTVAPPAPAPAAPPPPASNWVVPGPDPQGFPGCRPVDGGLSILFKGAGRPGSAERAAALANIRPAVLAAARGPVARFVELAEAVRLKTEAAAARRAALQSMVAELEAEQQRAGEAGPSGTVLDRLLGLDERLAAARAELASQDRTGEVAKPLLDKLRAEARAAVTEAAKAGMRKRTAELVARRAELAAELAGRAGDLLDGLLDVVGAMLVYDFGSGSIVDNMHRALLGPPGAAVPPETVAAVLGPPAGAKK